MDSKAHNFKENAQAGTYKECDGLCIYKVFPAWSKGTKLIIKKVSA